MKEAYVYDRRTAITYFAGTLVPAVFVLASIHGQFGLSPLASVVGVLGAIASSPLGWRFTVADLKARDTHGKAQPRGLRLHLFKQFFAYALFPFSGGGAFAGIVGLGTIDAKMALSGALAGLGSGIPFAFVVAIVMTFLPSRDAASWR